MTKRGASSEPIRSSTSYGVQALVDLVLEEGSVAANGGAPDLEVGEELGVLGVLPLTG